MFIQGARINPRSPCFDIGSMTCLPHVPCVEARENHDVLDITLHIGQTFEYDHIFTPIFQQVGITIHVSYNATAALRWI